MYRKYLKRWLDFVIVLCVLAVIGQYCFWSLYGFTLPIKERVPSSLRNVPDETENIQGNQVQNNDGRT